MPDQVQLRGGTAADNDAFTGVNREVTVDTTNKTLRVHNGTTSGGSKLAAYDEWGRLQVADPVDATDATSKSYVDTTVADSVPSIIDRNFTTVDAVNTTVETTIYSHEIAAGLLGSNRGVELELAGDYLNNSGAARNLLIRVKFGATIILERANTAELWAVSANRNRWVMRFVVINETVTSQHAFGSVLFGSRRQADSLDMGTTDDPTDRLIAGPGYGVATEDTAAARTLAVTIQHPVAHASLSMRKEAGVLTLGPKVAA